jgi:hypothetical protein
MYKYKNTLLHGLLFASLMVFPVAGFSAGSDGTAGMSGSNQSVTTHVIPGQKDGMQKPMNKTDGMNRNGGTGSGSSGISTSGLTLAWYWRGRNYNYPYRPYYYHYNYYPYRPYYYRYHRW